jgi:hypothetical protein
MRSLGCTPEFMGLDCDRHWSFPGGQVESGRPKQEIEALPSCDKGVTLGPNRVLEIDSLLD